LNNRTPICVVAFSELSMLFVLLWILLEVRTEVLVG